MNEILYSLKEDFERKEAYQPELFRDAAAEIAKNIEGLSKFTHFDTSKYHAKQITGTLAQWHIAYELETQAIPPGKGGNFFPERYLHYLELACQKIGLLDSVNPKRVGDILSAHEKQLIVCDFAKVGIQSQRDKLLQKVIRPLK